MSDTPKWPGEEEKTLPEGQGPSEAPPKWETVPGPGAAAAPPSAWPAAAPGFPQATAPGTPPAAAGAGPVAGGYTNLQSPQGPPAVGGAGYPPPPPPLPPPAAYPQGASANAGGGYQPVFGGGPVAGAPPQPPYGAPPMGPPGYGATGYPPQYPQQYPQQYPPQYPQQGNYGTNVAEMLAVGALMTGVGVERRRWRRRRHLIFWPLMLLFFVGLMLLRGCLGFLHMVADAGKPEIHALHDRMAQNDLGGIYDSADASWRSSESRAQSDALFASVNQQLGAPVNYSVRSVSINSEQGRKDLVLATVFARGRGTETLRFHKVGSTYKLQKYDVASAGFQSAAAHGEETF